MHQSLHAGVDLDEKGLALLPGEYNHRIRNIFRVIKAMVRQTQSTSVEDYRAKLIGLISGLCHHYETTVRLDSGSLGLAQLIEQTARPYAPSGARPCQRRRPSTGTENGTRPTPRLPRARH